MQDSLASSGLLGRKIAIRSNAQFQWPMGRSVFTRGHPKEESSRGLLEDDLISSEQTEINIHQSHPRN